MNNVARYTEVLNNGDRCRQAHQQGEDHGCHRCRVRGLSRDPREVRQDHGGPGSQRRHRRAFELPVVDMAKLLDPELSPSETTKLSSACRDWVSFIGKLDYKKGSSRRALAQGIRFLDTLRM
ncbi:unnamed protein product [Urochloa humidicola]